MTQKKTKAESFEPLKFYVQAVLLHKDADGEPVGEVHENGAREVYGIKALRDYVDALERQFSDPEAGIKLAAEARAAREEAPTQA